VSRKLARFLTAFLTVDRMIVAACLFHCEYTAQHSKAFIRTNMNRIPSFFRRKTLYNQPNQAYAKHTYFYCGKYPLLAYRWFLFGNVCLLTAFLLADDDDAMAIPSTTASTTRNTKQQATINQWRQQQHSAGREANSIHGSFADSEGFEPLSYQKRSSSVTSSEKDLHLDRRRENGMKKRWKALVLGSSIVTMIISCACYHHLLRHDGHKGSFVPMNDNSKSTSTTTSYDQKNVSSVQALKSVSILENLEHAAVAADHPICSKMGLDILQKGSNAP